MAGKVAAFREFGAKLKNETWSWSALTPDGKTVVLQLWSDRLNYKTKPISYSEYGNPNLTEHSERLGNAERINNLLWAQENCGGRFRVVIGVAKDPSARPRRTRDAHAQKQMVMKLVELDTSTGEFRSEVVDAV